MKNDDTKKSSETPVILALRAEYRGYAVVRAASGRIKYMKGKYIVAASKVPPGVMKMLTKRLATAAGKKPPQDAKTGKMKGGVPQDTNKNGTAGAPTKYDARFVDELVAFFDVEKYKDITIEKYTRFSKDGDPISETEKYKRVANDLPMFEAFAKKIGVHYSSLREWATALENPDAKEGEPAYGKLKYPEFSEAYNVAKHLQKNFLIQNGLHGHYPPASFIFVAKNITDMTDTQIVETKDTDLKDKKDAISNWFDTLRDDAKLANSNAPADEAVVPGVQEG